MQKLWDALTDIKSLLEKEIEVPSAEKPNLGVGDTHDFK